MAYRTLGFAILPTVAIFGMALAAAPRGRYMIANGVVSDSKTNLSWEQVAPSIEFTASDAAAYCAGLSLDSTGWRVPTVKELATIVDRSVSLPSIDLNAFPGSSPDWFWTSTPYAGPVGAEMRWVIHFDYGSTYFHDASSLSSVRCVR